MSGSRERGRNCPVHPRRIGNYANSSSKLYGAFLILRLSFTSDKLGIHTGGGGVCKKVSSCGSVKESFVYHPVIHILSSHNIPFCVIRAPRGGSIILPIKSISYSCHLDPARGGPTNSLFPFHIRTIVEAVAHPP